MKCIKYILKFISHRSSVLLTVGLFFIFHLFGFNASSQYQDLFEKRYEYREFISEEVCKEMGIKQITVIMTSCPINNSDSTDTISNKYSNSQVDSLKQKSGQYTSMGFPGITSQPLIHNTAIDNELKMTTKLECNIDSLGRYSKHIRTNSYTGIDVRQIVHNTTFSYDTFGSLISIDSQYSQDPLDQTSYYRKIRYIGEKKIRTLTEFKKEREGNILLNSYRYSYDKHGNIKKIKSKKWIWYQNNILKEITKFNYSYNDSDLLQSVTIKSGRDSYQKKYSYYPDGGILEINVIKKNTYLENVPDTVYHFNKAGLIAEIRIKLHLSGFYITTFDYNENNQLIGKITSDLNYDKLHIFGSEIYVYNEYGLISKISYSVSSRPSLEFHYLFQESSPKQP